VLSIGPLDGDPFRICTAAEYDRFYIELALTLAFSPWSKAVAAAFRRGVAILRPLPAGTLPRDRAVFGPEEPTP